MTSKESLAMYHRVANNISMIPDDSKHYEIIKKDLEVLDILKDVFNYQSIQDFLEHLSTEQCDILKEFSENQKLTNQNCNNYDDFVFSFRNSLIIRSELDNGIYKKLKQLEDVEEELELDLRVAVDVCKKVNKQKYVYMKESNGVSKLTFLDDLDVELFNHRLYSNSRGVWTSLDLKDYGNTWALTREELKNK